MIEEELKKGIFGQPKDKTFIDKLLARSEIEKTKELIKKERLTRSELLELLYMCIGTEAKLVNLSDWDRYVVLKFFVWIREFIKVAELMYDMRDSFEAKKKLGIQLKPRTEIILLNNERLIEHNAKFLIDLYFNILRTTLSIGGTGFTEILNNKFEINYPHFSNMVNNEEKKGWNILQRG